MAFADRVDATSERLLRRARVLVWNSIVGILLFLLMNEVFGLDIPYVAWPLLLAVVFGVPGALAAILLWAIVT